MGQRQAQWQTYGVVIPLFNVWATTSTKGYRERKLLCHRVKSKGPLKIEENPYNLEWVKGKMDDMAFKILCLTIAT